jgi:hypothetical protein
MGKSQPNMDRFQDGNARLTCDGAGQGTGVAAVVRHAARECAGAQVVLTLIPAKSAPCAICSERQAVNLMDMAEV